MLPFKKKKKKNTYHLSLSKLLWIWVSALCQFQWAVRFTSIVLQFTTSCIPLSRLQNTRPFLSWNFCWTNSKSYCKIIYTNICDIYELSFGLMVVLLRTEGVLRVGIESVALACIRRSQVKVDVELFIYLFRTELKK